ncbi:MAG: hypothetical protein SNH55_04415 [Rikenellaceae bacterium]
MNRNLINFEALFSTAAAQHGYAPFYCSAQSIMPNVQRMPAAVIYPSQVTEKVGVTRCRITTEITFLLINSGLSRSYEEKMSILNDMRLDILKMIHLIEANVEVVSVTEVDLEVDTTPLMHSDDLQMHATLSIVSNFTYALAMEEDEEAEEEQSEE